MAKPKIVHKPAMTVAVVDGVGNATTEVPRLTPALYKAVYGSKKLYGNAFKPQGKLCGRYFYDSLDTPDAEKHFQLAVPIPAGTTELRQVLPDVAHVRVEVWPEETVAEVMHTGPYTTEDATIQLLMAHVQRQGYEIVGPHEEEYLSGMQTPVEQRRTMIRYAVRPKGAL